MAEEREGYVLLGAVSVDSGRLMICDPSYVLHSEDPEDDGAWSVTIEEAMAPTLQERYGEFGGELGLVFRSGYGDGTYNVYGKFNEDERIVEVVIDMGLQQWQWDTFQQQFGPTQSED